MSGESNADRDLLAMCWQTALGPESWRASVLVELRGFEPLASAMRTQRSAN